MNSLTQPLSHSAATIEGHTELCRKVVGPLPAVFDCSKGKRLPTYDREGKRITRASDGTFYRNGEKMNSAPPLDGDCAHPAIAPGLESKRCAIGSTIVEQKVGGVTWVAFCRSNRHLREGEYQFTSMSVMGWNENGETCQFDYYPTDKAIAFVDIPAPGTKPRKPPNHQDDPDKLAAWVPPSQFSGQNCVSCHSQGAGPMIRTPSIVATGVSLTVPPEHRVIGDLGKAGAFLRNAAPEIIQPVHEGKNDRTCTRCHNVTTSSRLQNEDSAAFLLEHAVGQHGTEGWMPPRVAPETPEQRQQNWEAVARLRYCLENPQDAAKCAPRRPALTPCPLPSPLDVKSLSLTSTASIDNAIPYTQQVSVAWNNYRDAYGQKSKNPERDDVRFTLKIKGSDESVCEFEKVNPGKNGEAKFNLPGKPGVNYSVEVVPTRYCLDYEMKRTFAAPTAVGTVAKIPKSPVGNAINAELETDKSH